MRHCIVGYFNDGKGMDDSRSEWHLSANGNEPNLYLRFTRFIDNKDQEIEVPKVLRDENDMSSKYLSSEDTQYGVYRFAEITGLPYEFLNLLRRGLIQIT
jgi:hypothetical protein